MKGLRKYLTPLHRISRGLSPFCRRTGRYSVICDAEAVSAMSADLMNQDGSQGKVLFWRC